MRDRSYEPVSNERTTQPMADAPQSETSQEGMERNARYTGLFPKHVGIYCVRVWYSKQYQ